MSDELRYWPIEFLLIGKADYYPGVCQGTDPHDAMKVFLENYSPKGTLMAIRVPDTSPGGKLIDCGWLWDSKSQERSNGEA